MDLVEQIWYILSEEMSFETFTPILTKPITNGKNPKFEISRFFLINLVETPL